MIEVSDRDFKRQTRRGFLKAGVAAVAGLGAFTWLRSRREDNGILWPLRRGLELNEQFSRDFFSRSRLAPTFAKSEVVSEPRENGTVGLESAMNPEDWKLIVQGGASAAEAGLGLDAIRALPRVEMITELKCIEGWSQIVQWAGARFADFTAQYGPNAMTDYVYMETPDREYYVGLDSDSALHPQTLLAYEMNGAPLTSVHGAPLRLVIPVKYGIKNIKRIGAIRYTSRRPDDYWAERGYDWYSGH